MRLLGVLLVVLAASISGCATSYPRPLPVKLPALDRDLAALQTQVMALAIAERRKAGITSDLSIDQRLEAAARAHSEDMARRHYFEHLSPEGLDALDRLRAYNPRFVGLLAENIAAQRYAPTAGFNPSTFAIRIVDAWMTSPGHRRTLLRPGFQATGIGVARSGDEVFVTQLFSGPLDRYAVVDRRD